MSTDRLFPDLTEVNRDELARFGALLRKAWPLKSKHRDPLKYAIRDMSRGLTVDRNDRRADYMADAKTLSPYLYYFLPWNLYRLSRLFTGLDFDVPDGAQVADLGSGPLTTVLALWIAPAAPAGAHPGVHLPGPLAQGDAGRARPVPGRGRRRRAVAHPHGQGQLYRQAAQQGGPDRGRQRLQRAGLVRPRDPAPGRQAGPAPDREHHRWRARPFGGDRAAAGRADHRRDAHRADGGRAEAHRPLPAWGGLPHARHGQGRAVVPLQPFRGRRSRTGSRRSRARPGWKRRAFP